MTDKHDAAVLLGGLGGAAGHGAKKRRSREHYQRAAKIAVKKHACPKCGRVILGNVGLWQHLRTHAE